MILQELVAEQFTVERQSQSKSDLLFRLWFPESLSLVHAFDQLRQATNGSNELSIKLKKDSVDLTLRSNNGWEESWPDVPCDPIEITKVQEDKHSAFTKGPFSLQYQQIISRPGSNPATQPVATSDVKPIEITKVVWIE